MKSPRIKICGVTSVADALAAVELGADALGLNFYPPSPRCIDQATAAAILASLPPFVEAVGVFVNEPLAQIVARLQSLPRLRTIQWHGQQREVDLPASHDIVTAFAIQGAATLTEIQDHLERCRSRGRLPRAVLVDGHAPGLQGGTGHTAPWDLLASFRPGVPVILAGGLKPDNVGEAIRRVRPYAVDVASGVEEGPGKKSLEKMRSFIGNVRAAGIH